MPDLAGTFSNKQTLGDIDSKVVGTPKGRATSTTLYGSQKPEPTPDTIYPPARYTPKTPTALFISVRPPARYCTDCTDLTTKTASRPKIRVLLYLNYSY